MIVPKGNATSNAPADVTIVPATSGMIPYRGFSNNTVHCVSVRNSTMETFSKKDHDSNTRVPTIPSVMATEDRAQRKRQNSIERSFMRFQVRPDAREPVSSPRPKYSVSAGEGVAIRSPYQA